MRSGDVHANPVVQEAAQAMRTVVNRVKVAQQKLGLLPPDEELKAIGQESYFPRVYKVGKIVNERDKFREMLVDWWSRGEKKPCPAKRRKLLLMPRSIKSSAQKFLRILRTSLW